MLTQWIYACGMSMFFFVFFVLVHRTDSTASNAHIPEM